jgi:hypothetical protein
MGDEVLRPHVPSPKLVAAWLLLHDLDTTAVPQWAAWWIIDGHDGPAVVELAGLDGKHPLDVRDATAAALEEIGIPEPSLIDAVRLAFDDKAQKCLTGRLDELDLAGWVEHVYIRSDYNDGVLAQPLGETYGIDDEWQGKWGRLEPDLRLAVRDACVAQLRART